MTSSWHRPSRRSNTKSKQSSYGWRAKSSCVCEHCQIPFVEKTWVCREGYSYHQECHKCYYCGCKNLNDAEIFNGVIFCADCSDRIFHDGRSRPRRDPTKRIYVKSHGNMDNAVTARRMWSTKTQNQSRARSQNQPSQSQPMQAINTSNVVKNERTNNSDSSPNSSNTCSSKIITSTQTDSIVNRKSEKVIVIHEMYDKQLQSSHTNNCSDKRNRANYSGYSQTTTTNNISQTSNYYTTSTNEQTTTTFTASVNYNSGFQSSDKRTQSCLDEALVTSHRSVTNIPRSFNTDKSRKALHPEKKNKKAHRSIKIEDCSDLRMHALGQSTEIANQALLDVEAQASESTVFCRNIPPQQRPPELTRRVDSELGLLDRRIGSLLKLPFTAFKKRIIERSSLIDAVIYSDNAGEESNFIHSVRTLLLPSHQQRLKRGEKKLYKTIRRKQNALKLGWVRESPSEAFALNSVMRCPHYHESYSYRCMRKEVMRLAGPTVEQLNAIVTNVKELFTPKTVKEVKTIAANRTICSKCGCEKALRNSSTSPQRFPMKSLICV